METVTKSVNQQVDRLTKKIAMNEDMKSTVVSSVNQIISSSKLTLNRIESTLQVRESPHLVDDETLEPNYHFP